MKSATAGGPAPGANGGAGAADQVMQLDQVTKCYADSRAVDAVSLTMPAGEVVVIVGPSGCGKSTLLRAIAGLTGIDSGRILVDGREMSGPDCFVPAERRGVGIVFQDLALFPHLTVADNVNFGLRHRVSDVRGKRQQAADEDAGERMLNLVGLQAKAGRYPHELSGGEQQRVAIARALALDPSLVLLDEPFSHLDKGLATQVRTEAMQTLRAAGASVVLVTHDQDEALAVGDRVAVMQDGRLIQVATPAQVFHRPVDEFVATFVGEADFMAGHQKGDTAATPLGTVPVPAGPAGPVRVMVRPHDLSVRPLPQPGQEQAGPDGVVGHVVRSEFRGGELLYVLDLGDGVTVRGLGPHNEP
ncbi:MAG: ABC transporter ATP-binding protein, partial [Micrococcales bacterium]